MNSTTDNLERQKDDTIKFGDIEIFESADANTTLELKIPLRFYIHGKCNLDRYEEIAIDLLRNASMSIFEHISRLGSIAETENWSGMDLHGILDALGLFGQGLTETQQTVQMSFERFRSSESNSDVESFVNSMKTVKFGTPAFQELQHHFADEMYKAIKGRICIPERMAKLYPIFREINLEQDEIKAEQEKSEREARAAPLTVEERLNLDRRAVAEWLAKNKKSLGNSFAKCKAETPEQFEMFFASFDRILAENPDDEIVLEAADQLLDLAKTADAEIADKIVNVAINLQNPNDETVISELSGRNLASVISELLENPNLPKTFEKFLCIGLNEIYNSLPKQSQQKLDDAHDDDFSAEYITDLFKYGREQAGETKTAEKTADLSGDDDEQTVALGNLAVLFSDALANSFMPDRLRETLTNDLKGMSKSISAEHQRQLGEFDGSPEYLGDLFEYYIEDKKAALKEDIETEAKNVLDLSKVCTEFLGTNEATAGEKRIPLANLLSAVMKHPDLPTRIYETLGDELCDVPSDLTERPEVIQLTLERLKSEEGEK